MVCSSCSASGACHLVVSSSLMHVLKVFSRTHELMWSKHAGDACGSICRCWIDQQDRRQAAAHDTCFKRMHAGVFMPHHDLICDEPPGATTHQPESPAESSHMVR